MSNEGIFRVGLDTVSPQRQSSGNGSMWLYIKPDETIFIAFMEPPSKIVAYNEHNIWRGKPQNSPRFPCIGEGCPGCEMGHKPRYRAIASVLHVDKKSGDKSVKLFGFGRMIKNDIVSIANLVGEDNFTGAEIAISRTGAKLNTRYSCTLTNQQHDLGDYDALEVIDFINPKDKEGIEKMLDEMRVEESGGSSKTKSSTDDELEQLRALVE